MSVFELTKQLIAIPSISGDEEAVAGFLADYLENAGFDVEMQKVAEGRPNVYARIGEPRIVMSTHTDTVPPYIEFSEDDLFIYGRGACDAKGVIAAMVKAAEAHIKNFGLLFVVGEEAGSPGAKAANNIANRSLYLINGEPTESKIALGSKGALRCRIKTKGRAAHSAYPEMGESAIDKLLEIIADLRNVELPEDQTLGATTLNIGTIKGGIAANVIPPAAEAELMFRVVTGTDSIKGIIKETIRGRADVEYTFACDPVFTERVEGFNTAVVAFTTDIPLLTNWGKPVLFGPGSILDAHTAHEKISKKELSRAADAYAEISARLLKAQI